jgi:hypothetical protein
MGTYYADLSLSGTGGDGSIGNPWHAGTFQLQCNSLVTSETIYVKGQGTLTAGNLDIGQLGGFLTILPWEGIGVYAINMLNNSLIIRQGSSVKNLIANVASNRSFTQFPTSTLLSSFIKGGRADIVGFAKGCTFVVNECYGNGCGAPTTLDDSIIDCANFGIWANVTSRNCCFTGALPSGNHSDYQINWIPPTWPAWNAAQSAFSSALLSVGITTPPQPGNSPYTDYEIGLWETTRTGIGAMAFESTTTTTGGPTTTTLAPAWPPTKDSVRERTGPDGGPGARSASYDENPAKRVMADYHAPWWLK